jgi:hypothetical protein
MKDVLAVVAEEVMPAPGSNLKYLNNNNRKLLLASSFSFYISMPCKDNYSKALHSCYKLYLRFNYTVLAHTI